MTIKKLKSLTKEEFLKYPDATESIYILLFRILKKAGLKSGKKINPSGHRDIPMHSEKEFLVIYTQQIDGIQRL